MIERLKPYPAAKQSGVKWLGSIPAHWQVRRLKTLCSRSALYGANISADSYTTSGVRFLRTTDITERGELTDGGVFLPEELARDYILAEGDLLVSRSGTIGRSLLYSHESHGRCAYAGYLVRFRPSPDTVPKFLFLYTKTRAFEGFLNVSAISSTIENVNGEKYANCPLPLPPLPEQTAIARFLDHMDRRIQKYIRAKEKLIALLDEYKQALIHQAVTGQIDVRTGRPYGEYKESGVEWIGRVPRHWSVVALRRRWSVTDCKHLTVPFVDCGVPLASVRQVQSFELDLGTANHTTREWFDVLTEGGRGPKFGDLIFCRNVSVGSAALVTTEEDFAMGQDVCLIRSRYENQRWLNYYVHSNAMSEQIELGLVGSTFNRINVEDIKALLVLVPPVDEQGEIASFLDYETKRLDTLIWNCGKQQEAMREYRTRLIADVVTGKLDVREAVAGLRETDSPLAEPREA